MSNRARNRKQSDVQLRVFYVTRLSGLSIVRRCQQHLTLGGKRKARKKMITRQKERKKRPASFLFLGSERLGKLFLRIIMIFLFPESRELCSTSIACSLYKVSTSLVRAVKNRKEWGKTSSLLYFPISKKSPNSTVRIGGYGFRDSLTSIFCLLECEMPGSNETANHSGRTRKIGKLNFAVSLPSRNMRTYVSISILEYHSSLEIVCSAEKGNFDGKQTTTTNKRLKGKEA